MNHYITNEMLMDMYIDDKMLQYLIKKSQPLSRSEVILRTCEVLKWLFLGGHTKGAIPFNVEIDEIWHLLILQTRQYKELADKLPHKKFIHHSSNAYEPSQSINDKEAQKIEMNRQVSYLVSYVYNFGPLTEEIIIFYTAVGTSLFEMCMKDIRKLNDYLFQLASKFRPDSFQTNSQPASEVGVKT